MTIGPVEIFMVITKIIFKWFAYLRCSDCLIREVTLTGINDCYSS